MSTISDATVRMDYNQFEGVTFNRCRIHYAGGPYYAVGCKFIDCLWIFDGPAGNMLRLMAMIYHNEGGKDMIEETFGDIRRGQFREWRDIQVGGN
jgi:hypothetical protein